MLGTLYHLLVQSPDEKIKMGFRVHYNRSIFSEGGLCAVGSFIPAVWPAQLRCNVSHVIACHMAVIYSHDVRHFGSQNKRFVVWKCSKCWPSCSIDVCARGIAYDNKAVGPICNVIYTFWSRRCRAAMCLQTRKVNHLHISEVDVNSKFAHEETPIIIAIRKFAVRGGSRVCRRTISNILMLSTKQAQVFL